METNHTFIVLGPSRADGASRCRRNGSLVVGDKYCIKACKAPVHSGVRLAVRSTVGPDMNGGRRAAAGGEVVQSKVYAVMFKFAKGGGGM